MLPAKLTDNISRLKASHAIRSRNSETGVVEITSANLSRIIESPLPSIPEQAENFLFWLSGKAGEDKLGSISLPKWEIMASIIGAVSKEGVYSVLNYLSRQSFVTMHAGGVCKLTPEGWEHIDKLEGQLSLAAVQSEPNWESGTLDTFVGYLKDQLDPVSDDYSEKFIEELAEEIRDQHSAEMGMAQQFDDLAYQQWLAGFMAHAVRKANAQSFDGTTVAYNRETVVFQITTLVSALQENLDIVDNRSNVLPEFDLALYSDPELRDEIRSLTEQLKGLREAIESEVIIAVIEDAKSTITMKALNSFVKRISAGAGKGLEDSVAWGTRIALAFIGIAILEKLGFPVDELWASVMKKFS